MKRAALPLAVAGLACAALVACHTGVGGHLSEPDKDEIRKVVDEAVRAILPPTSDAEAYVNLYYAEDAQVLPPNQATVTDGSWKVILDAWNSDLPAPVTPAPSAHD